MQNYIVRLESPIATSFKCVKAAQSLDIDVNKKSVHELKIECDIDNDFSVGLILGASGSGKTTLAKKIYGDDVFENHLISEKTIIDQLPDEMSYDECANLLSGIGLTSVPCWIRPAYTLSNGQKARAEAAIAMTKNKDITVIDEWTSVVDRTVAKVMSHCVQKHARKTNKKIVLLSCHYDVIEWLNPDWIIDCNQQKFIDRRLLSQNDRKRKEQLSFDIREVDRSTWKSFSKYHYLSDILPGGIIKTFGIFCGKNQIGFQCFANYVPRKTKTEKLIMHSNRTVIHPDYAGLGLGILLINETSEMMHLQGYKVMAKFSSTPVYKAMSKYNCWKLKEEKTKLGKYYIGNNYRKTGFRENIKTYSFLYVGK